MLFWNVVEAKNLIDIIKFDLKNNVKKHMEKGLRSNREAKSKKKKIQCHIFTSFGKL